MAMGCWDDPTTNEANWPLSGQFDFIKEVVNRSFL